MLFGFRLEELENLVGHFVVRRKSVEVRASRSGDWFAFQGRELSRGLRRRLGKVERRRLSWKREAIPLFERSDVFNVLRTGVADFEEIGFQNGNAIGQEFGQRAVKIVPQRSIQSVLENVRKLAGNLGEARETVARRSTTKSVSGDVEAFEIFVTRLDVLQDANIFAEILQVLRGFLEEHFDGFAVKRAHARPSVTSSAFCDSSAVGFRYRMQSLRTIA